ncbi:MAG: amidohydrolase [Christensenellaceae bacterium]|nr:amidohydrolase [Christensenellaceae bacterium]
MLHIINAHLKPITSPDIPCGELLIDGGKIVAIGEHVDAPADAEVYDAQGKLVTPGLMDAHTHIGLDEEAIRWEGADYNEYSNPVTPHMRAIDGINPRDEAFQLALEGGVTSAITGPGSANVIGGTFAAIKLHGVCVDDMILKQPVAMKIAFGENPKGCYGQNGKKEPVTRMAVAALLRENLAKAKRYAEEVDAAEKDPSKTRPYDIKLEALLPVIRKEIPLKAHAHRADDILTALRVANEFDVDITLDHVTEGHLITDILVKAGKPVLVGPSLGNKSKFELKEKTFATAGILNKAGLDVCIITDAPVIPLYHLPLCAGLAVRAGLDEDAAWRAITINPAKVAGVDSRVGSLEIGKDADIAVFEGDPLRDIQARAVRVYVDGKAVV